MIEAILTKLEHLQQKCPKEEHEFNEFMKNCEKLEDGVRQILTHTIICLEQARLEYREAAKHAQDEWNQWKERGAWLNAGLKGLITFKKQPWLDRDGKFVSDLGAAEEVA